MSAAEVTITSEKSYSQYPLKDIHHRSDLLLIGVSGYLWIRFLSV
jgi:hypothetical protein